MALKNVFNSLKNSFPLHSLNSQHFYILSVQPKRNHFKAALNMNTVYFHNESGDDNLEIQLTFQDENFRINKTFNFHRKMSEPVDSFLKRLDQKLEGSLLQKATKKKKGITQEDEKREVPELNSTFLVDDQQIPAETIFENLINDTGGKNVKLKILSKYYEISMNCPSVTELTLPENAYVGCPVFPEKFKGKCTNINNCKFTWFKTKISKQWEQCGEEYFYVPTAEDLNYKLKIKCLPKNDTVEGPPVEFISEARVKNHDNFSLIEKRHAFTGSTTGVEEIRVVTYNILANAYATTKEAKTALFTYCDPIYMDFSYRKDLLLKELTGYNADLICLQEVDKKMFDTYIMPYFTKTGFSGVYVGKKKEGFKEGCVIFCRNSKFRMMDTHQHVLSEELQTNPILVDIKEKISQNNKLMMRVNDLQTQMEVAILESLTTTDKIILVGNAHLYFHPNADHIRLLQGIISFKILLHHKQMLEEKNPNKKVNLIFCGDFNSTPDCGIYKFCTTGAVTETEVDWRSKSTEEVKNISFNNPLKMKSAYGAPKYTNYTKEFKECLDYIYFQTDNLELKQIVPLPEEEDLSKETAIPSAFFPSDHIALIADLKWRS